MTTNEQKQISVFREQGLSQSQIASELGLNVNAVKSWCRRHPLKPAGKNLCLCCGVPVEQQPKRKEKKFCSDRCRFNWWNQHPEEKKKAYHHVCQHCGTAFDSNRPNSCYCSQSCYAKARRKEAQHDG